MDRQMNILYAKSFSNMQQHTYVYMWVYQKYLFLFITPAGLTQLPHSWRNDKATVLFLNELLVYIIRLWLNGGQLVRIPVCISHLLKI